MDQQLSKTTHKTRQVIGSRETITGYSVWEALSFLLPQELVKEVRSFKQRNVIILQYKSNGGIKEYCCDQCLKAHAIAVAKKWHLDEDVLGYVEEVFPGELGHGGYYMDQEEVVTVT